MTTAGPTEQDETHETHVLESDETFTCPFDGCIDTLQTERSLRAHLRAHRASVPIACTHHTCKVVFPTLSQRNAHIQTTHNHGIPSNHTLTVDLTEKITAQIADDCRFDDSILLNSKQGSHTDKSRKGQVVSLEDNTLRENNDIREIADNATYLVRQIRDAWVSYDFN